MAFRFIRPALLVMVLVAAVLVVSPGAVAPAAAAASSPSTAGAIVPVEPTRLLDTRTTAAVPGGSSVAVQVAGRAPVPAGTAAVFLTVTVTAPTAGGYLRVRPSGGASTTTSSLNFVAGQTVANSVLVPVGNAGRVAIDNVAPGRAQVIVDVTAYTTAGVVTAPGAVVALPPARLLDTRAPASGSPVQLASGAALDLPVLGRAGLPLAGVGAVVLNVTATQPTGPGFLAASPGGAPPAGTSNLNWTTAGQIVANQVQVPVDSDGRVRFTAGGGASVHVVVDVQGYVLAGRPVQAGTVAFFPKAARAVDTRSCCAGPVGPDGRVWSLSALPQLPPVGPSDDGHRIAGVVATVTVTNTSGPGFLTVWSGSVARPLASNANWSGPGQTVAATVVVPVVDDLRQFVGALVGGGGRADIVVDVSGYVLLNPSAAPPAPVVEATGFQQGPTHDGHAGGSLPTTMTQKWDVDFGATEGVVGYPIIANGQVFVVTNRIGGAGPTPYQASLWAYDLAGNRVWGPVALDGSYHKNRMAWDDGRLYVVDDAGGIAAYTPSLALVWKRTHVGPTQEPMLAAGGGRLYTLVQQGYALGALDGANGNILWTAPIPRIIYGSFPPVTLDATGVYVGGGASDGATSKFDTSGRLLWQYSTTITGGGAGTPVSRHGRLWTRIDNGTDGSVLDTSTGSLIGSYRSDRAVVFSGEVAVTALNGAVIALSERDGSPLWSQGIGVNNLRGCLLATDDTVYVGASDDTVRGYAVATGLPVWTGSTPTTPTGSLGWDSGMAIGGGLLLVPNGTHLTAFG